VRVLYGTPTADLSLDMRDQAGSGQSRLFGSSGSLGGWSNRATGHVVTILYQL
jgi:hypothetical protein